MSQVWAGVRGLGGPCPAHPSLTLRCFCSWTSCCRVRWSCCFWNSANRSCFCSCCCCLSARSSCCSCCSRSAGSTGPARAPRSSTGLGLLPPPPPMELGMAPGSTGFTSTAGRKDRKGSGGPIPDPTRPWQPCCGPSEPPSRTARQKENRGWGKSNHSALRIQPSALIEVEAMNFNKKICISMKHSTWEILSAPHILLSLTVNNPGILYELLY